MSTVARAIRRSMRARDCTYHPSLHYKAHVRLECVDNAFEQQGCSLNMMRKPTRLLQLDSVNLHLRSAIDKGWEGLQTRIYRQKRRIARDINRKSSCVVKLWD